MEEGQRLGFRLTLPEGCAPDAPLVVVLGWYGAADRHVAKYSSLLEKQGFPSVRAIMPGAAVFSPAPWPKRRFAAALLDFITAADPDGQRKLVFYAFSNGGAFVLEQLEHLVHGGSARHAAVAPRIAGVVYDSAPCYMHPLVGASAISTGLPLPARVLAVALFLLVMLVQLFLQPLRPRQYWRSMQDCRLAPKSLYLYSADDPLCDAARLDALVAARQKAGADVAAVRWDHSQHVAHLLKHPKEYTAALFGFLEGLR